MRAQAPVALLVVAGFGWLFFSPQSIHTTLCTTQEPAPILAAPATHQQPKQDFSAEPQNSVQSSPAQREFPVKKVTLKSPFFDHTQVSFLITHVAGASAAMLKYVTAGGEVFVQGSSFVSITHSSPEEVVLDVGSNVGFFSLIASSLGRKTFAWDLQQVCLDEVRWSAHVNGFDDRLHTELAAASDTDGVKFFAGQAKLCKNFKGAKAVGAEETSSALVVSQKVDTFLERTHSVVSWMKVDTEGMELSVLRGAVHSARNGLIRAATVEVTPGWWREKTEDTIVGGFAVLSQFCGDGRFLWTVDRSWSREMKLKPTSTLQDVERWISALAKRKHPPHLAQFDVWFLSKDRVQETRDLVFHSC